MPVEIRIKLNDKFYLRDPEETDLGRRIIQQSILLIDKIGFEAFTFKKLSIEIESTEASIYRYFENKHVLLVYLSSWYWAWIEYRIDIQTNNIKDAKTKLKIILKIIAESGKDDLTIPHIDESVLHRIVVRDSSKSYCNINVDKENKEGFFKNYKSLCATISKVILEINPKYKYPSTLASTLLEASHQQLFFAQHLPSLSNLHLQHDNFEEIIEYLEHLAFTLIQKG